MNDTTERNMLDPAELVGEITPCSDCDGTRIRKKDGVISCCPMGHARECMCAICQWKRRNRSLSAELDSIMSAANELVELLREKWSCPDQDALTLYMAAIVAGIKTEWLNSQPQNGFVNTVMFPDIGSVQIEIRRAEGQSAAARMRELTAERDEHRSNREAAGRVIESQRAELRVAGEKAGRLESEIERLKAALAPVEREANSA